MDPLAPKVYAEFIGITDVGRRRKQNEDNFLVADLQQHRRSHQKEHHHWQVGGRGLLFAVCDGMGGAAAGEVASQMAVDILFRELQDLEPGLEPQEFASILDRGIQSANHQIHELAQNDETKKGMGTTVSAAAVYGNILFLAQVGDSRAYLLRGGKLIQVTKDQSLLERLIEEGAISPEHAENFTGKNVILQALGPVPQVLVDLKFIELEEDDVVLLCSDGLHGPVNAQEMLEILYGSGSLVEANQALIDRANHNGGPDNITSILVRLNGEDLPKPGTPTMAVPQPVKYVRAPVDAITLRLEKELGLTHWLNKTVFAPTMLMVYALVILLAGGWAIWKNRAALTAKDSSRVVVAQKAPVVIVSDVQDATLFVDDVPMGRLRRGGKSISLATGKHRIYLRSGSWTSPVRSIELTGGDREPPMIELNQNTSGKRNKTAMREWLPGQDPE